MTYKQDSYEYSKRTTSKLDLSSSLLVLRPFPHRLPKYELLLIPSTAGTLGLGVSTCTFFFLSCWTVTAGGVRRRETTDDDAEEEDEEEEESLRLGREGVGD